MPEESQDAPVERDDEQLKRWKYPIAALVILVFVGLVVFQTVKTGEIPYTIAVPLLAAALWGLFTFRASDFTGGGK